MIPRGFSLRVKEDLSLPRNSFNVTPCLFNVVNPLCLRYTGEKSIVVKLEHKWETP